jgi:hypothetical protein
VRHRSGSDVFGYATNTCELAVNGEKRHAQLTGQLDVERVEKTYVGTSRPCAKEKRVEVVALHRELRKQVKPSLDIGGLDRSCSVEPAQR